MHSLPTVTILLSLYKPAEFFLQKQLESLENQDYDNLNILIWDDCVNEDCQEEIAKVLKTKPYTYLKCSKNLGYIKAFEHMVDLAKSDYIAFCDQDDIWEPQKITRCIEELLSQDAILATSDRMIINENDEVVIPSFRHYSKEARETWQTGNDISCNSVFTCYALGMTIVMKTDAAKKMIPFSIETGHDKWVTMCAATMGKVIFIEEVLQRYRRHGKNVTGIFNGVTSKDEYYRERVDCSYAVARELVAKFPYHPHKERIYKFASARKEKNVIWLLKLRTIAPRIALFEIFLKFTPAWAFKIMLKALTSSNNM